MRNLFPNNESLGSSKLKKLADNNFKFDENGGNGEELSERV